MNILRKIAKKIADWELLGYWTIIGLCSLILQLTFFAGTGSTLHGLGFLFFWLVYTILSLLGFFVTTRRKVEHQDEGLDLSNHLIELKTDKR